MSGLEEISLNVLSRLVRMFVVVICAAAHINLKVTPAIKMSQHFSSKIEDILGSYMQLQGSAEGVTCADSGSKGGRESLGRRAQHLLLTKNEPAQQSQGSTGCALVSREFQAIQQEKTWSASSRISLQSADKYSDSSIARTSFRVKWQLHRAGSKFCVSRIFA